MKLSRYFHTLRYLRPVQFYGRLWFRLYRPRPDYRPAPPLRPVAGRWITPPTGEPCLRGPATFHFLNETRIVAEPGDWNAPGVDKLWLYNLHYFDDLNAAGAAERQAWHHALIERWIAGNPPGHGNGWEPYPLSLRIVNWIQWAQAGNALNTNALHSLAIQTRYLAQRLEHHLLGNHLFANAKALVYAGLFFAGAEAERWLQTGRRLLDRERAEQILPDGGHFERSPMYHAILLKDLLDLLNLEQVYPNGATTSQTTQWQATAQQMLDWLAVMTHPDGDIAFFNDAALGIAQPLAQLADYAGKLGIPAAPSPPTPLPPGERGDDPHSQPLSSWEKGAQTPARLTPLPASGYLRLEAGPAVLIVDAAPIGPDYLPGHAHADTLSFELSLHGQRIFVNSGTSCYGTNPERQRQRGTAAHNTVTIDDQDSSEVWGGFRVARRARPIGLRWGETTDSLWVEGSHDGYQRLPGRVTHGRRWTLSPTHLRIQDRLDGRYQRAIARLHLHPAIHAGLDNDATGWLELPNRQQRLHWMIENGQTRLIPATWHPCFGVSDANHCLEISCNGPETQLFIQW